MIDSCVRGIHVFYRLDLTLLQKLIVFSLRSFCAQDVAVQWKLQLKISENYK